MPIGGSPQFQSLCFRCRGWCVPKCRVRAEFGHGAGTLAEGSTGRDLKLHCILAQSAYMRGYSTSAPKSTPRNAPGGAKKTFDEAVSRFI